MTATQPIRIGIARMGITALIFSLINPAEGFGQMESMRFQLGRRLHRFERAWEGAESSERAACVDLMDGAVRSFFGLQLDTAAQLLDQANQKVQGTPETRAKTWLVANRSSIDFEIPWIDASRPVLRFRLRPIGKGSPSHRAAANEVAPATTEALPRGDLRMAIWADAKPIATGEWKEILPLTDAGKPDEEWITWELPPLPAGDYRVSAVCETLAMECDLIAEWVSISENLEARMLKGKGWYEENRRGKGGTALATARWLVKELKQGEKGQPTEIDVPWNRWLEDFEALRDRKDEFLRGISKSSPRSYWLQLSNGEATQIVRLGTPGPLSAQQTHASSKIPVLFAFHGAGGSENMFFETYGAGRLVELASGRGWLVVSPRQSLGGMGMSIEGMLAALEEFFPIDRERVMLVGHSMGAAQAIAQVSAHADQVRAVAALGGGGVPGKSLRSSNVRFYVAAGDRDFGLPRAKSLADTLRNLGCSVEFREFTDVEHMVIVQAALDEVFAFLDQSNR